MASTTSYDNGETNGHTHHETNGKIGDGAIIQYLSEALRITLATSQEELEAEGAPLASSEVAQSVERLEAFFRSTRPALYAQKLRQPSDHAGEAVFAYITITVTDAQKDHLSLTTSHSPITFLSRTTVLQLWQSSKAHDLSKSHDHSPSNYN
jgi:hypothetical protein